MSVSVLKDAGAFGAVYSVVSEVKSMFPPAVPIGRPVSWGPVSWGPSRGLCRCCGVGALGTVQIMVGLFNIGLGPGRTSTHPEDLTNLWAAYWLGAVFIIAGVVSLLAEQWPYHCNVGWAVFANIVCALFSIAAIALYAMDLWDAGLGWMCDDSEEHCRYAAYFAQRLLTGMDVTLIILSVLLLVVSIILSVFAIRAVIYQRKQQEASSITCTI